MKRILSVILSLALLASLLIIPMSVSADTLSDADKAVYTDLISAVDNLKLDFDFAQKSNLLVETAYPIGSQVRESGADFHATTSILNKEKVFDNTPEDNVPEKIGSKYVSVEENEDIKTGFWNIKTSHLHTIRCQYDTQPVSGSYPNAGTTGLFSLKDSGYLVVYVKTARPFKLGVNFSNNQASPAVEKDVAATSGYEPVIIDMTNINWPSVSSDGYATNNKNWGYFLTIRQMTTGEQTITPADGISFGTVFTIPVDTNVRDFKYIIDAAAKPKPTTAKRFDVNADDFDPAAMIIAAEKITNDGRYTADSYADLQTAITDAKESFLKTAIADTTNGVDGIKTLLLSELEDAGTVEEVWQPKWIKGTGDFSSTENVYNPADGATGDTIIDTNASYFGSCVAKLDSTHKTLSIIGNGASTPFGDGSTPINVNDYADVWMYVYNNTASAVQPDQFIVVSTGSDSVAYKIGLLPQGLIRIDIASILKKANDQKKNDSKWNTNRIQLKNSNITAGATYYGTVFGLKKIDTTELSEAKTTRDIVDFYTNKVAGKNYQNTANADETMDIIGLPPVITIEGNKANGTEDYCGSATVNVIDTDIATITVNNEYETSDFVNGKFEFTKAGTYTVVATDAMGNTDTKTFTVVAHSYKYSATGAVITETCDNCSHSATVTLVKDPNEDWVYSATEDKRTSIHSSVAGPLSVKSLPATKFYKVKSDTTLEEVNVVKNAGNYVAKATIDDVAFAELPFTIEKAIPDYTAPAAKTGEAGAELSTIAFLETETGFTWANNNETIAYGEKTYTAIFTPTDTDNYLTRPVQVTVTGDDTTVPTGTIKIKETIWDKLANLFIKDKETVTITGSDTGSGVDKIYYYVADAEVDGINNIEWTEYTGSFKIEKEGNNFVYAKIVDVAGNVTVINTDCIVLDKTAPVADITNLGKYYGSLTVTVIDDYVDTVTLNGKEVQLNHNEEFTVSPAEGVQKIVITDMAGNKAEYEVTVLEVKGLDAESEAQGEKVVLTVDSKDKDSVDKTSKDKIDEKLEKGEKIAYFEIDLTKASGGAITNATNVFEIKIPFDFAGKNTNVRVLHNHDGVVRVLDELTARPTGDLEDGKFYADKENNMIYIYTSKFSTFAVTYHTHTVKHVAATVATAEADGNIEYWYCEECGKYFSDAAATKEISKADTVVKYVAPSNGNTGSGSNAPTTGGETENNATVPGGTSPVTGETAMTVVLFAILLGALAVMGISIVKSRKAKSK